MESTSDNDRWAQLMELQDSVDSAAIPLLVSRRDGKPRKASDKTVRFAEALAFRDGWSGISNARRRGNDLAA